jgi:hypothetical protein
MQLGRFPWQLMILPVADADAQSHQSQQIPTLLNPQHLMPIAYLTHQKT